MYTHTYTNLHANIYECGGKLMAEVLTKFGATSFMERDVDKSHGSPIAPPTEATPTDFMNQTQGLAIDDRLACFFSHAGCFQKSPWWFKSSFSPAHAYNLKLICNSFWLPSLPLWKKIIFAKIDFASSLAGRQLPGKNFVQHSSLCPTMFQHH